MFTPISERISLTQTFLCSRRTHEYERGHHTRPIPPQRSTKQRTPRYPQHQSESVEDEHHDIHVSFERTNVQIPVETNFGTDFTYSNSCLQSTRARDSNRSPYFANTFLAFHQTNDAKTPTTAIGINRKANTTIFNSYVALSST